MLRLTYRDPDLSKGYERSVPDDADRDYELTRLAGTAHELDPAGNKALLADDVRLKESAMAYGTSEITEEV